MAAKRSVKSGDIQAYIKDWAIPETSAINVYDDICNSYGNNEVYYAAVLRRIHTFRTGHQLQKYKSGSKHSIVPENHF
jgi:hypothetical protein